MAKPGVLLVEDDALQRRQMVRVLKAEGYLLRESSTAEEAIRILSEQGIALVVSDKRLPDMDGLDLLRHVRVNYPNLPVVIMTGLVEDTMDPEPDGLLVKPFSSNELKSVIRRLLSEV